MQVTLTMRPPRETSFNVTGSSAGDLRNSLNSSPYWGAYTPDVAIKSADRGDRIERIEIINKPELAFPRWRGYSAAQRELKAVWDSLMAEIRRHEMGHASDYRRDLEALKKRLEKAATMTRRQFADAKAKWDRHHAQTVRRWHSGGGNPARAHNILRTAINNGL